MSLANGVRLGPYEIISAIGAGGMGEVYRATDTTLARQVAIKVLPESLAADAERLARFDREARTLASLNHPNIAAIYGLERAGSSSALVMELVDGLTLAERIAQGALPLDEALPIASQIAKALEAAHEQGIIHRDLKPANIKVRPDGTVKVLDFGLAKALAPETTGMSGNALNPTITSPAMMTGVGMILGTAAYMSPEQARGRAVDRRADIWAFGAVLFEMLSGERAFAGEDVSDTLADVMRVEPAWSKLPEGIPPALLTFLKQCLRKNPAERVRDIGDVRLALEGAFDTVVSTVSSAPVVAAPPRPLWRRALPIVAALLLSVVMAAAAWYMKPVEPPPVVRVSHIVPPGRSFRGGARVVVAVSPNGRQVVYNASEGLYLRSLDALIDRLIPGTEAAIANPTFSPDGLSLAFSTQNQIRRISLGGGASVPVARTETVPLGISWEPDGSMLYATRDGIWQVQDAGGEPKRLIQTRETQQEQYLLPQWLPGGEWILATMFRPSALQEGGDVVALLPATGERRILQRDAVGGKYVPTGHLLYVNSGVLYAVPFDAKHLTLTAGPVAVVEGVRSAIGVTAMTQFAVSPSGTLTFVPGPTGTSNNRLSLATADLAGTVAPIKGLAAFPYVHVRATRDGKTLVLDSDDGKEAIVWIYKMGGAAAPGRLTFGGRNRYPIWSPDGRRVAFQSDRDGDPAVYVQNADGTGTVERLTQPAKGNSHIPESWSKEGHLSFAELDGRGFTLWTYSFADRKATRFRDLHSTEPFGSTFSNDGKWIAYHLRPENASQTAPSSGVFVEPFPPTAARYQAPRVNFDFQPMWSYDGTQLLYIPSTASGQMAAATFTTVPAVTFGSPSTFPFTLTANQLSNGRRAFDVLPDGRLVGLNLEGESVVGLNGVNEVRIVVNWFDELRRLAPVK